MVKLLLLMWSRFMIKIESFITLLGMRIDGRENDELWNFLIRRQIHVSK